MTVSGLGRDRVGAGGALALPRGTGAAARAWRRFRQNRLSLAALGVCGLMILFSYGAPLVAGLVTHQDYAAQNLTATYAPPGSTVTSIDFGNPAGVRQVTNTYLLGSDELGRDVLTRLAYGGRISLTVSFLALAVSLTIGLLVGSLAGFYGGLVDQCLMRLVDVVISVPGLFVLILVSAVLNNNTLLTKSEFYRENGWLILPFVIALLAWTGLSRLVRGQVLSIRAREFVEAARLLGASDRRILFAHILPNVLPTVIVWATLVVPGLILTEAALSYLGFGVQIPTPSWGNMLTNATQSFTRAPQLAILPGALIFVTVMAINLLGNGLRDAIDPSLS